MSFDVERLGDLLIEEATFLHGVTDKVREIQVELELMQTQDRVKVRQFGTGLQKLGRMLSMRKEDHRHFCPQSCLEEEKGFSKHPQEVCLHLFRVDCSPQGWDRD